ncbi:MAG: SpoIIE family protein phosphatase [Candidatus Eisenbacteria bacterium]|nr:SpoIIE family protein phosphatase [Candidatus Eisenbacteria bacterium]MBU1947276.1 SpoIIE family protein phosphatase [Candidatus Eisenbacteria bacterium]
MAISNENGLAKQTWASFNPSPPQKKPAFSIRFIVTAAAIGITMAAVLIVGTVQERNSRKALVAEVETRLMLEARNLAMTGAGALLRDYPELTLHPLIKEMQTKQPELALVLVIDHEGKVQGHADSRELGQKTKALEGLKPETAQLELGDGEAMLGNSENLVASAPVLHPSGQVIGTAVVGLQRNYINQVINAGRRQQLIALSIVLILGVMVALILMTSLLRPVGKLRAGLERIGQGDLNKPIRLRDRTELGMLVDTVNDMAAKLKKAQSEMVEKERFAHELELAREIQASLLPKSRIVAKSFFIDGAHRAASEVGGDYYDIFELANGKIGVAIADVAGKGLAGCLAMSMLSALLRAFRDQFESPKELLIKLDERLGENLSSGSFVTMYYGILDPETGRLVSASAGHSPTIVYHRSTGQVEQRMMKGIPLGAVRGGAIRSTLNDEEIILEPGDMLLQYTDGVNEAFGSASEEQFGFERMEIVFKECAPRGCVRVIEDFRQVLDEWRAGSARSDDETFLVVSREICVPVEATGRDDAEALPAHHWEARRWLETAKEHGIHLRLPANLDQLDNLTDWLIERPEFREMEESHMHLLSSGMYEVCANVMEHGYKLDPEREFDLWWLPESSAHQIFTMVSIDENRQGINPTGYFLLLDQGVPFSADNWVATDFWDPEVWRRLRGFGLDIIHKVMSRVVYRPATPEGNVTLLAFDISKLDQEQRELPHGF